MFAPPRKSRLGLFLPLLSPHEPRVAPSLFSSRQTWNEKKKRIVRSLIDLAPISSCAVKAFITRHDPRWSSDLLWLSSCAADCWRKCRVFFSLFNVQAGQFKPPNQSKQQSSRTPNAKKMLHAAVSETSSMASTQLPYYIPICRIWRPLLIKIKRGCHFCFSFVWFFFLINCLRMLEMRRVVSVGSKWNECCL